LGGTAIEVADALLQLFDGYEPVPGAPALGLIAQTIEPLVGPPTRTSWWTCVAA
jgi:hypothetical protein